MTYTAPPPAQQPMLPALTPEEERNLALMQQRLASPQPAPQLAPEPAPMPAGDAMAAMQAPPPASQPAPVGPALQDMSPSTGFILPAILSSGGTINREVYDSLTPIERNFLDGLKRSAPGGTLPAGKDLATSFNNYADDIISRTALEVPLPNGESVLTWNGQIIHDDRQLKPELITGEDGTQYFADPSTATATPIMANGQPVRKPDRLSASQANMAMMQQNTISQLNTQFESLMNFPEDQKVSYNQDSNTYQEAGWIGGITVKEAREKIISEQRKAEEKLASILDPTAAPKTPTPDPFKVGKTYRDANGNTRTYKGNGVWE